jgi:transcription elongation factor GreA
MEKEILVTQQGLDKMYIELDQLRHQGREEIAERIKEARAFGDLSENVEYSDAKDAQAFLETRIIQLEEKIRTARVVQNLTGSAQVTIGSYVEIMDLADGKKQKNTYQIVGFNEAEPSKGSVSNQSPIGRALLGHKVNDEVEIQLPARVKKIRITSLK